MLEVKNEFMKKLNKKVSAKNTEENKRSREELYDFFIDSLQEMYYAEREISEAFSHIINHIVSPQLLEILKIHYSIHQKHVERLEKIFHFRNEKVTKKVCKPIKALITEANHRLSVFAGDTINWEIALILVSQKLAYYKIASYSGLAHIAINLEFRNSAALLAFSVQEEEEFIANHLSNIINSFISSHIEDYKNDEN